MIDAFYISLSFLDGTMSEWWTCGMMNQTAESHSAIWSM